MTMLPIKRKCQVCGKNFNFNPDVGKINCPHCGTFAGIKSDGIPKSLEKRENK